MASTKISFEIEVEGTFQNGNTLDKAAIYELLAQVAEQEYDRQFESNKITRRFNFSMTDPDAQAEPQVLNELEEVLELDEEPTADGQPRRKRKLPNFAPQGATKLFLPH